jgi:hypothetical protein
MDIIKMIERCGSRSGTPTQKVSITNCGVLDESQQTISTTTMSTKDGLFANTMQDAKENVGAVQSPKAWYQIW